MKRLGLALRTFFLVLRDAAFRQAVEGVLAQRENSSAQPAVLRSRQEASGPTSTPSADDHGASGAARSPQPARGPSEALVLLAALQREARLVDFLKEPLGDYTDAQIGAAVRDVHRDAAAALERWFGLRPVLEQPEGASIEVPPGYAAAEFRLTGRVSGGPPYRGTLAHHGWRATRCELPAWTGTVEAAYVIAPAEVEL